MKKNVWLLCGCPASGKSTFAKEQIEQHGGVCISRDEVRFSLVSEDEPYFSKEKKVFNEFIKNIQIAIMENDNVYVDATHLNEISRNKVLDRLRLNPCTVNIIPVNFFTPLELCLERNAKREGRAKVPEDVVKKMYESFRPAQNNEKYTYDRILSIERG